MKGYGRFRVKGTRTRRAHRLMWEVTHSRALESHELVCHECDNPACCNPEHLFLGSHQDNMDDKVKKELKRGKGMTRLTVDIRKDQLEAMRQIQNRASFVRAAIDVALEKV